jgi:hypothetical protein
MSMSTMQTVYVMVATCMMLFWLVLVVLGPRRVGASNILAVLRYGVVLRTLALALALTPPLITVYVIWAFLWKNQATLNFAGITLLAFSAIAGLLLIEVTRVQVMLTEEGITRYSPWSGPVTVKWIEVEHIRYSSINRWFAVAGAGLTIRVSRHLVGIGIFAQTVRRKVASERCANAATVLDALKDG